jgi:hypothetical protein
MAVSPLGTNRATVSETASGGGATATASVTVPDGWTTTASAAASSSTVSFDQSRFEPAAGGGQAQALGAPASAPADTGSKLADVLGKFVEALKGLVDLLKTLSGAGGPGGGAGIQPGEKTPGGEAGILPGEKTPGGGEFLNGTGAGGVGGPGTQGTQQGAFGVPAINQKDPNLDGENASYTNGLFNCGPASLAQIARGKSMQDPNYSLTYKDDKGQPVTKKVADMTNEELVTTLGKIAQTDKEGTSPNGIIDAAAAMGLDVDQSEVKFDSNYDPALKNGGNSFDQAWLDKQLEQGKSVVVNGAFQVQNPKTGEFELSGHYATVAGKNKDGTYAVVDPWDGQVKNLTAAELERFMEANEVNGGVMLAIG